MIFNPTAGRRKAGRLWAVLDVLVGHGVRLDVAETRAPGHARTLAAEAVRAGRGPVVAAGGDGTVAEVADGMAAGAAAAGAGSTEVALGIVPLGTANVLAHELHLPASPLGLASALAFGRSRPLWPGRVRGAGGERLFVQMLGVGFDAQVVHGVSTRTKRAIGRGAYVVQTLRELPRYGFPPIRVVVDGEAHAAGSVIVAKGGLYGGPYMLAPEAATDAPGFSAVLFEHAGVGAALLAGAALPLNRLGRLPGVRRLRASRVVIEAPEPLPAQADGDACGWTPLVVEDAAVPLRVLTGEMATATGRGVARAAE